MNTTTSRRVRPKRPWCPDAGTYQPGTITLQRTILEREATRVADVNSARAFIAQLEALRSLGYLDAAAEFQRVNAPELAEARALLGVA